jgi:hypothetical protein
MKDGSAFARAFGIACVDLMAVLWVVCTICIKQTSSCRPLPHCELVVERWGEPTQATAKASTSCPDSGPCDVSPAASAFELHHVHVKSCASYNSPSYPSRPGGFGGCGGLSRGP